MVNALIVLKLLQIVYDESCRLVTKTVSTRQELLGSPILDSLESLKIAFPFRVSYMNTILVLK